MPDFTCLDENLFAKVAQTLLQHISSTHCNFKSALGPLILLLCVRSTRGRFNERFHKLLWRSSRVLNKDYLKKVVLMTDLTTPWN